MSFLKRTVMNVIGDRLTGQAQVADVLEVSKSFRFIDLESESFKSLHLQLGDKLQINTGNWNFRTYTPVVVDRELGRVSLLAYVHGDGPGAKWATATRPGDPLQVFGPRRSLKLPATKEPLVIFGDETSVAVIASIQRRRDRPIARIIFEASIPAEVEKIVRDMGLENVEVYRKTITGEVLEEPTQAVLYHALRETRVVLTGRAESIQHLRRRLRAEGIAMSRVTTKAYWATGKRGLD